jgi:hypothetical protein
MVLQQGYPHRPERTRVFAHYSENLAMTKIQHWIQGQMYPTIPNGHGFVISVPIWMLLNKYPKVGQQFSGGE